MSQHNSLLCFLYFPPCGASTPAGPCQAPAAVWPHDPEGDPLIGPRSVFCRPCAERFVAELGGVTDPRIEGAFWTMRDLHEWSGDRCTPGPTCQDCTGGASDADAGVVLCPLHAAAAEMRRVLRETYAALCDMTTSAFAQGADRPIREAIETVLNTVGGAEG